MALTIVLLILRIMPPRPRWRSLFRQPGMIACLTLVVQWLLKDSFMLLSTVLSTNRYVSVSSYFMGPLYSGQGVILTWGAMALARIWRPEPSWIDRAGRGIGLLFIFIYITIHFVH